MDQTPDRKELISITHLDKWYTVGDVRFHALKDISLTINRGSFTSIIGPSGSGKSTLMNIIGCLDTFDKGNYLLAGRKVSTLNDKELAHFRGEIIGFVFQTFNLLDKYSVLENVLLPSFYVPIPNALQRALEILEQLGLSDKQHNSPLQISGGQKQRVAIARALMANPEIILADEPTGNLDSASGKMVLQILKDLNKQGKTVILITHDQSIAQQAGQIIKIFDGRLVTDDAGN